MKIVKKFHGFTLLELLVAITSSTIILGGFMIAFSSLNKVSKQQENEMRNLREGTGVRSTIEKAITGASNVVFKTVTNNSLGEDYDMLYYYKYDDKNLLTEYGFFYLDEQQQAIDPSYFKREDYSGNEIEVKHLFYERIEVDPASPEATAAVPPAPEDFNLRSADRQLLVHDATDFDVNLDQVQAQEGLKRISFNLDYQVTTKYFTGESGDGDAPDRRERIFKGSTHALGRVTS